MKIEPISVFAINATILADVTPSGESNYIVRLTYDAGTAIDRVKACSDYKQICDSSHFENDVFINQDTYLAYSFNSLNNNTVYLLTCRCKHPSLSKEESLRQIDLGMKKAFEDLDEKIKKQ